MEIQRKIEIKVCGMRDADNIMQIASLLPTYLGFIFYPKSPRFVGEGFKIPVGLPSSIKRVGVFVNESTELVLAKADDVGFEIVQLHGHESPEQCLVLKESGLKVIKVFSVDDNFKFEVTQRYKKTADYFLFDTKGKFYGGNAKTFNWNILNDYDQEIPFFLSGGLSPDNVKDIQNLNHMNIHALDFNSGVELSPGTKSKEMIEHAIKSIAHVYQSTTTGTPET